MRNFLCQTICFFLLCDLVAQRPAPASPQTGPMAFTGATLHIGNGDVVEKGIIVLDSGKITGIYDQATAPPSLTAIQIIDVTGMHIYPGFISPNTSLGLREVDAVRATLDYQELTKEYNPEIRTIIAYNADSKIIPTVRLNGVLYAQPVPSGGTISGTSSLVQLDAWNWEDAAVVEELGIHINWPHEYRLADPNAVETKANKTFLETESLKEFFRAAAAYASGKHEVTEFNQKWEACTGLFDSTKILFVHARTEKEILESISFFESVGIKRIVLTEPEEGHKVLPFLQSHHIPVILPRLHELPFAEDEDVFLNYTLPKMYADSGIVFCLSYAGSMEAQGSRNLPFVAGTAVAYGLDYEKAVQSVTLDAANILGVGDRIGSLTVDKAATFFVSTGDALDMRTNQVVYALIDGRIITLTSHQTELYEMYKD